jgi:acetyl esterase/lipase
MTVHGRNLMKRLANFLAICSALLSAMLLIQLPSPRSWLVFLPRLVASSLSRFNMVSGLTGSLLGLLSGSPLAVLLGGFAAETSRRYVQGVSAPHGGFERAFGKNWQERIPPGLRAHMLRERRGWFLPATPRPNVFHDVVYATLPGSDRQLLCDIWTPANGISSTGVAYMFIHGGAWYLGEKDMGTRTFFRQLCAQGHVVMDIAYRMYPETTMPGIVADIFRALAWLKEHAAGYGASPDKIVVSGGSAGGHLALMAAFAGAEPELVPEELHGRDLSTAGVVSFYGPTDLRGLKKRVDHSGLFNEDEEKKPKLLSGDREFAGTLHNNKWHQARLLRQRVSFLGMMGCTREQYAEVSARFSPICYARAGCPPTLLIQGGGDMLVSPEQAIVLQEELEKNRVPVILLLLPQTEHAFDLVLPKFSPAMRSALYDIERFLGVLAGR